MKDQFKNAMQMKIFIKNKKMGGKSKSSIVTAGLVTVHFLWFHFDSSFLDRSDQSPQSPGA